MVQGSRTVGLSATDHVGRSRGAAHCSAAKNQGLAQQESLHGSSFCSGSLLAISSYDNAPGLSRTIVRKRRASRFCLSELVLRSYRRAAAQLEVTLFTRQPCRKEC